MTFLGSGVSFKEKFFFTKHLSLMLKSGIPITEILSTLATQAKGKPFRETLLQVAEDVSRGQSLNKALGKHPRVFSLFYRSLVEVGEKSGTLEESLFYLVEQMEKERELQQKVQSAMLYPGIVLTATGVIGFAIAFFILPQIVTLFESFDVELPLTTVILIFVAHALQDWGLIILPGAVVFLIALAFLLNTPAVKPRWHALILRFPIFGYFFQNVALATLTRNLGIMLKSGLPITSALATSAEVEGNLVYKRELLKISEEVQKGKSIEAILLEQKFREFPIFMVRMVGVGEKSGNLEENLAYLGDYFEDEVDTIANNLAVILEPALLLFIGGVVAFVALSIISPIYSITGSIR
ncbi:hypothetical protein A2797_02030 [candidate division WWE3 bacterium RIFCSPHIGHO2_01_FULL_48_15]|uniref:Type II secretion system protein GspF domain-containing protein n=1 Tax=candidate division WWE3 bacterium RIFCSPHIGHO2_01_FULL_48_15 TaxID=1802619 RepID=A0A1F4VG58_UNCKA|nr:MAG: hypothetical protein A2797_02030 [candidate division WWE3 bacterium RIFCSPHIGHO2_01_FULL_48_15]